MTPEGAMTARKPPHTDYVLIQRGSGFHGHVTRPLPGDLTGAGSAIRYLVQLASEWGDLSGARTRTSDIDWSYMEPSDHAHDEFKAISRESFSPTLNLLRKRLARTNYAELSKECVGDIVSLVFFEAFYAAFEGRAKSKRRR
jgi:hypothetical protein